MPSDAEIAAYASNLPPIYRAILAAFPEIEPGRKAGYGLAFQTLAVHFANSRRGFSFGEVQEACKRLAESGFVEIKNKIFAHPTDLGEQLIAAVTGSPPASEHGHPPVASTDLVTRQSNVLANHLVPALRAPRFSIALRKR